MDWDVGAVKKKIGSRIQLRRDHIGMSQDDLAYYAKVSQTYLSQVENGKRNPSVELLYRICCVLKIELIELFRT